MLPEATIKHSLRRRLRLQVMSKRGDSAYFEKVENWLKEALSSSTITVSALTGCLVIENDSVNIEAVRSIASQRQLFLITPGTPAPKKLAERIAAPIRKVNCGINVLSDGALDLPGALFLLLLIFGVWELAIGNFRRPPWYTAFWYAFGLFSKSLYDELNRTIDIDR
ncbi:MAG: hypothetical protein RBT11_07080 [Desulfobacterales bacterium]|jgi:hypothetical protein|nr:hypothetical protein [Desulfobacterales bacterium]